MKENEKKGAIVNKPIPLTRLSGITTFLLIKLLARYEMENVCFV
jgi:hypothetical protein